MSDLLVKQYYTENVRSEWRWLVKDAYHRLEFTTTLHFLDQYLPPHGRVLDAGGGPGRYTLELAKRGYDVTLLDATGANLDFARRMVRRHGFRNRVEQIVEGSIVDLSQFPGGSFDAVVRSGGHISHILESDDRRRTISELVRVAKPGAPIFASVMGRLAVLVVILEGSKQEIGTQHFNLLRDTGDYLGGRGFTACHFFLPQEFRQEFNQPDVEILEMAGLEGTSTQHVRELNQLAKDPERIKYWLETHLKICTDPSVVGMSEHMLIVCRKIQENRAIKT